MTKIDFISLLRIHNNNISLRLQDRIWKFLVNICCKLKCHLSHPVLNKWWCSHSWKRWCSLRRLRMRKSRTLAPDRGSAHQRNYNREEPILTPCWICFFDHLLFTAFFVKELCPSAWMIKWLFSSSQGDNLTLTNCEWLQKRKNEQMPSYCTR